MKKSKRLKHKLLPIQYVNTNCPLPGDVDDFLRAIKRFYLKKGPRAYQKDRDRCDRLVRRLLIKHHIIGTISARFWYMEGYCMLITKTQEQIDKAFRRAAKIVRRAARIEKRKKKHGKKHKNK